MRCSCLSNATLTNVWCDSACWCIWNTVWCSSTSMINLFISPSSSLSSLILVRNLLAKSLVFSLSGDLILVSQVQVLLFHIQTRVLLLWFLDIRLLRTDILFSNLKWHLFFLLRLFELADSILSHFLKTDSFNDNEAFLAEVALARSSKSTFGLKRELWLLVHH